MSQFIPFPAYEDDAPIDLSFVFAADKPAGNHGFLTVRGNQFVFEDGAPGRFWGTNFNGGACFPSHEYSRKVAGRLAKFGCNIVRFHQLDAEWNTPNIFQYAKGARKGHTGSFDVQSMDCLDYLIYELKEQGIYCYLDLLTYRKFKEEDGVNNALKLLDAAKPYAIFDRTMIDLEKEYAHALWTHYNPYTKLCYKDDPVFVLCEVINEADLYSKANCELKEEPYVAEFRNLFASWLKETGIDYDAFQCDVNGYDEEVMAFKMHLSRNYYREMYDYIRSLGVRIPLTGTNWTRQSAILKDHLDMDFTDSHYYVYDWRWGETEKLCLNRALSTSENTGLAKPAKMRTFEKPFFMSEWDMPWPNPYRAESPILFAAINDLQDWCGMAIHTYAYGTRLGKMNVLGKEVSSSAIGGVPYREGVFSTWNDPAKFGLFYHCALMVRRMDVKPAKRKIACNIQALDRSVWTAMHQGLEVSQVASCFEYQCPAADKIVPEDVPFVHCDGELVSDTGELYRNWKKGYGAIDAERTKCLYGMLARNGKINMQGMSVAAETDFAVIAVSSLTDMPLSKTDNMLLTTVGRAKNTGYEAEGEKTYSVGCAPILIEVIKARIALKTENPRLRVCAVNAEGYYIGYLDTEYREGTLFFTVGERYPSMYYLIQAE